MPSSAKALEEGKPSVTARGAALVASAGEPWVSYFEPGAFAADMRASGYATAQSLGSDELNRRYFSGRSDGFRLYGSGQMMAAQV